MVVDIIFPGWMPWRRLALAQDMAGYFAQVERMMQIAFDTLVAGHVARVGTRADVQRQSEFMNDLKAAAGEALRTTKVGEGLDSRDLQRLGGLRQLHRSRRGAMRGAVAPDASGDHDGWYAR